MQLNLQNIAGFKKAHLEIDGITLIGGLNNTGKSTLSKSLYALCNALYKVDRVAFDDKVQALCALIKKDLLSKLLARPFFLDQDLPFACRQDIELLAQKIVSLNLCSEDRLQQELLQFVGKLQQNKQVSYLLNTDFIEDPQNFLKAMELLSLKIKERLEIPDRAIVTVLVQRALEAQFAEDLLNKNAQEEGRIKLKDKEQEIIVSIKGPESIKLESFEVLHKSAIYIDDPLTLNALSTRRSLLELAPKLESATSHTQVLLQNLIQEKPSNITETLLIKQNMGHELKEVLNSICQGVMYFDKNTQAFRYKVKDKSFNLLNLAAGLKLFVILKTLILNGTFTEESVLILDEPESHMHPTWQIALAKIIVLLQKNFNLQILINSHSVYLIRAIERSAKKYGTDKRNHYYLTESYQENFSIKEVTDNMELIYEKFATSLSDIEAIFYK